LELIAPGCVQRHRLYLHKSTWTFTLQIEPATQIKADIEYAEKNPYRSLITSSKAASYLDKYNKDCLPQLQTCYKTDFDADCYDASVTCGTEIDNQISNDADFDVYDLTAPANDAFPSKQFISYLQNATIQQQIGARHNFTECSEGAYQEIISTGDCKCQLSEYNPSVNLPCPTTPGARSFTPTLSTVIQSGVVQAIFWGGDRGKTMHSHPDARFTFSSTDWICNVLGQERAYSHLQFAESAEFNSQQLKPYTVNGVQRGLFKTAGKVSYLRVSEAGHEIPAYQPEVALQVFDQTINHEVLKPT